MAITDLDDDNKGIMEEDSSYTFRQLMDKLYIEGDIILTIPAAEEEALRNGLIMRKSKDNKQSKAKGLLPHTGVLTFNSYPVKDGAGKEIPGQVCVRVILGERKSINVIKMEVPSNDL